MGITGCGPGDAGQQQLHRGSVFFLGCTYVGCDMAKVHKDTIVPNVWGIGMRMLPMTHN